MKQQVNCPQCETGNKCRFDHKMEEMRLHRYCKIVLMLEKLGLKSSRNFFPPWLW